VIYNSKLIINFVAPTLSVTSEINMHFQCINHQFVGNLAELLEKEKSYTGEISQDSNSAIFIQISCFAAEIFYWH